MGGPPAYLAADTAPQPPATIVNVPTASAAHLAANEYFGLSSAIVYLFVRRVDGVGVDFNVTPSCVVWLGCAPRLQRCNRSPGMDSRRPTAASNVTNSSRDALQS